MSSSSELQINVHGVPLFLNKERLAAKSAKVAALIKENPHKEKLVFSRNIPAVPEAFDIVARFCHGFELNLTTNNVIPVICLAYYLEMTENHCNNNLLRKATTFLEERVLPSWNEIIKAFRSADENILKQALDWGLVDTCFDRLVEMALLDPCILGEPFRNLIFYEDSDNHEDEEKVYRPNARRKLIVLDWKPEDLTTLSLQLYEPIIGKMNKCGVPPQYVTASLYQYVKKWVFSSIPEWDVPTYKKSYQRDVIEAVERLLPHEKGLLPCTSLSEMLRFAISLESTDSCRSGLEARIGKQLDEATVKDLLIPSEGYTKELQYDIDCVNRILTHFYSNYESPNSSGVILVAELIEEFLAVVASDIDLNKETFVRLAKMSISVSEGTHKNFDGIYRAVDIYLDKHRFLTGTEREEVCQILDCQKMSSAACEHAAKNERLPMRFVVQVLFVTQLQMRDTITKAVEEVFDDKLRREDVEEEEKEFKEGDFGFEEEEMRSEIEKMSLKVMEIEKECLVMRKKIEGDCIHDKAKKEKVSMWKAMKRKLGCMSSFHDCKCQTKKKKHSKFLSDESCQSIFLANNLRS